MYRALSVPQLSGIYSRPILTPMALLSPLCNVPVCVSPELWTPKLGETWQLQRAHHMQAHAIVPVLTDGPRNFSIFFWPSTALVSFPATDADPPTLF